MGEAQVTVNRIVLRTPDVAIIAAAEALRYDVVIDQGWELDGCPTLFVASGTVMPLGLLETGFGFLRKWDVAAPLWRYGVLAADVGTEEERGMTEVVILDLRQLLYAHELLFVRPNEAGRGFLERWRAECEVGGDERLAFLRALHQTKPRICALPQGWRVEKEGPETLAEVQGVSPPARDARKTIRPSRSNRYRRKK